MGLAGFTALLWRSVAWCSTALRPRTAPSSSPVDQGGVGSAAVGAPFQGGLRGRRLFGQDDGARLPEGPGRGTGGGQQFTEDDGRALGPQLWPASSSWIGGMALAEALRTVRYGGAVAASRTSPAATTSPPRSTRSWLVPSASHSYGDRHGGNTHREQARPLSGQPGRRLPAQEPLRRDGQRGDRPARADGCARPRARRCRPGPHPGRSRPLSGP